MNYSSKLGTKGEERYNLIAECRDYLTNKKTKRKNLKFIVLSEKKLIL